MVDADDIVGRDVASLVGCELHVVVDGRAVAPGHRVVDGTRGAHVDTARTSVTLAVVDDVGTRTLVVDDGTVVERAALIEVDTAGLGIASVVADDGGGAEGVELRRGHEGGIVLLGRCHGIFAGRVADGQSAAHTGCRLGDIAVLHGAVVVDGSTAAIALHHTDARGLAGVDVAALHRAAAVHIDTAATHRGGTLLDDTVAQQGVLHHVGATAITRMVVGRRVARGGVASLDGTAVDAGFIGQTVEVAAHGLYLCLGVRRIVGSIDGDGAVGTEPDDMIRVEGERRVVVVVLLVVGEGDIRQRVVAREDGLVLEVPAAHRMLHVVLVDLQLVLCIGGIVLHKTLAGKGFLTLPLVGCLIAGESTEDVDTLGDAERGVEHRAVGIVGASARRHVGALGYIDIAQCPGLVLDGLVHLVDGSLQVVLRRGPGEAVVGEGTVLAVDVANLVGLCLHLCGQQQAETHEQ